MSSEFIWFWIAIEPNKKEILGFSPLKVVYGRTFPIQFQKDMANIEVQEMV